MRKLKKFFKKPHLFIRDYLNKKYPIKNIEQPFFEPEENNIIILDHKLDNIIRKNTNITIDIDVVFTWVDGKDPMWFQKYSKYSRFFQNKASLYATDVARFEDHNELYFSVLSVLKFMPWVRYIFIVTDQQIPKWFNTLQYPKIKFINHDDIIDEKYLPTFNSHVIEAFLHRIPNLSENFIYFNDDVFVARELKAEHFFQPNGIASIFLSDKSLSKMKKMGNSTATLSASQHSISLLNKYYNNKIDSPLVHTYFPLKKSIYNLAWELYNQEIEDFVPNKLRTNRDLNLASFLIPWLMYYTSNAIPRKEICYYFNIRSPHALIQYKKLLLCKQLNKRPHSFCANDFNSNLKYSDNYRENLINFLKDYYDCK